MKSPKRLLMSTGFATVPLAFAGDPLLLSPAFRSNVEAWQDHPSIFFTTTVKNAQQSEDRPARLSALT